MDIATPFHIFIFLYQRKKETRDKTNARLQILIFVSYFYSSFIHFLRITLQTPFIFLYFILREREKQETKQTPPAFKYLSLSLISIVHSLIFYESLYKREKKTNVKSMCFENSKYTGHQRSCVFLIDHVTESFLDVCTCILRNFSNSSLIYIVHSFIHFLRIALHSLRYFYVLFSEEERNKSQNKRPVFKYLSLSLNSIVHSLFFYESHCKPLSCF